MVNLGLLRAKMSTIMAKHLELTPRAGLEIQEMLEKSIVDETVIELSQDKKLLTVEIDARAGGVTYGYRFSVPNYWFGMLREND